MLAEQFLKNDITYWPPSDAGGDGYGKVTLGSPTALRGRWEDKIEQVLNARGEEVVSKTRIFLKTPVEIGGYMVKGTSIITDPRTLADARPIINVTKSPDLRNLSEMTVAFL